MRTVPTTRGFFSIDCRKSGVDAAQPIRHSFEQGIPKSGDLGQCIELVWPDDQQLQIREGCDRGATRPSVQHRQLPEEVAGAECVDPPTGLNDLGGTSEDEEELPVALSLPHEDLALVNLDLLRQTCDASELGLRARPDLFD